MFVIRYYGCLLEQNIYVIRYYAVTKYEQNEKTTTPGPDAKDHGVCSPDLDQTPRTLASGSLYIIFDMLFDTGRHHIYNNMTGS